MQTSEDGVITVLEGALSNGAHGVGQAWLFGYALACFLGVRIPYPLMEMTGIWTAACFWWPPGIEPSLTRLLRPPRSPGGQCGSCAIAEVAPHLWHLSEAKSCLALLALR